MRDHRTAPLAAWIVTAAGSVSIIVGTFLPWVVSGRVNRHLYQLAGVADRLGVVGNVPVAALFALPVLCALPSGLMALSLLRTGAVASLLLAAIAIFAGSAVLAIGVGRGSGTIAITPVGPVTVAIGGLVLLAGAVITIRLSSQVRRVVEARPSS
ncbi:MAG: hypothetical protein ABI382_14215 [Nakamurella sp.]